MGQIQSLIRKGNGFQEISEQYSPPPNRRKVLEDPRSPSNEVLRTPIETLGYFTYVLYLSKH